MFMQIAYVIWYALNLDIIRIVYMPLNWHVDLHWLFINITDIYIHARVSKTLYCVFWDLLWLGILQTDTIL